MTIWVALVAIAAVLYLALVTADVCRLGAQQEKQRREMMRILELMRLMEVEHQGDMQKVQQLLTAFKRAFKEAEKAERRG